MTSPGSQRTVSIAIMMPMCVAMLLMAGLWGFDNDDAYITYRYAKNLSTGDGLVYNPGERLLGTTTPLYALILGLLSAITLAPHVWGKILSGLALGVLGTEIGIIIGRVMPHRESAGYAFLPFLLGAVAISDPLLLSGGYGAETFLHAALIVGAFMYVLDGGQVIPGILLGLATVCRGDGAVALAVFLCVWSWRHRKIPYRIIISFMIVAGPWFVFSQLYYGSLLPQTLEAKRLQGQMWGSSFLEGIPYYTRRYAGQSPLILIMIPLAVIGLFKMIRERLWIPLALATWAIVYLAAYAALKAPYVYIWYFSLVSPVLSLTAFVGIAYLWQQRSSAWRCISVLLIALMAWSFVRCDVLFHRWLPYPRHPVYVEAADWLRHHTTPDASVAAFEVGAVGYFSERRIIDLWGLLTPEVARRTLREGDGSWAIRRHRPSHILFQRTRWGNERSILGAHWFPEAYRYVRSFTSARFDGVDLYELMEPDMIPAA